MLGTCRLSFANWNLSKLKCKICFAIWCSSEAKIWFGIVRVWSSSSTKIPFQEQLIFQAFAIYLHGRRKFPDNFFYAFLKVNKNMPCLNEITAWFFRCAVFWRKTACQPTWPNNSQFECLEICHKTNFMKFTSIGGFKCSKHVESLVGWGVRGDRFNSNKQETSS